MKTFTFKGTAEIRNVEYFVEAENEAEAIEKAKAGDWTEDDWSGAETVNSKLDPNTCELVE